MTGRFVTERFVTGRFLTGRFVCESYHIQVLALGADDPAPDENTVISSEPVSILFVLRYVFLNPTFMLSSYSVCEREGGGPENESLGRELYQ